MEIPTYDVAAMLTLLRDPAARAAENPEKGAAETDRLRRLVALNVGDPARLDNILGTLPAYEDFYGSASPARHPTADAIDIFLTTYSKGKGPSRDAPLTVAPAIDYAAMIEQEDPQSLENLIKNRDYEAAIEIIEREHLKNPKKSVYFAEQLRFLRKLQMIEAWSGKG